jgi:hypothetical protein
MTSVEIIVMTIAAGWLLLAFTLTDMQARREKKSFSRPPPDDRQGFAAIAARQRAKGNIAAS